MSEEKKNEVLGQEKALDDQEMDDIAAGAACTCYLGGGGTADRPGEKTCACVAGGGGEMNDEGAAAVNARTRCWCVLYGDGDSRERMEEKEKDRKARETPPYWWDGE